MWFNLNGEWKPTSSLGWSGQHPTAQPFAVPVDFTFEPQTIEINGKPFTKEQLGDAVWNAIAESTK